MLLAKLKSGSENSSNFEGPLSGCFGALSGECVMTVLELMVLVLWIMLFEQTISALPRCSCSHLLNILHTL